MKCAGIRHKKSQIFNPKYFADILEVCRLMSRWFSEENSVDLKIRACKGL